MKMLLLASAAILPALNMYAQGSGIINFGNTSTTPDRRIYFCDGQPLSGSGYRIALYWGRWGTPEGDLVQAGSSAGFLTGTAAGTFAAGSRTLQPLSPDGPIVTLQARAWQTIPGVPDTYEGVLAAGNAGARAIVGKGPVFDHKSKDP